MDGELLNYNNKRKMKENKLFTQEAVNTALKVCVLGSLGLANPRKLAEALTSLPRGLRQNGYGKHYGWSYDPYSF